MKIRWGAESFTSFLAKRFHIDEKGFRFPWLAEKDAPSLACLFPADQKQGPKIGSA